MIESQFIRPVRPCGSLVPERLQTLWFAPPEVVLTRGEVGAWDEFGVRDPSLLVDNSGRLKHEDGALVMYFTGSCDGGRRQACGRAVSFDEGASWLRAPDTAIWAPSGSAWNRGMRTTPHVVYRDDLEMYVMYYRGGPRVYEDAIGIAVSRDGIHFEANGDGPVLKPDDFPDMPVGYPVLMGLPHVVRMLDGRWLMTFEGDSTSYGAAQIFGAVSEDGFNFEPMNGGQPLFTCTHVRSINAVSVANPRMVTLEEDGVYVLVYNASGPISAYSLGLAFSRELTNWVEHPANPILNPTASPYSHPFSGRIEGGVLVKEDVVEGTEPVRLYFMAIPRHGPSHHNGVIGLALGRCTSIQGRFNFSTVIGRIGDIQLVPSDELPPTRLFFDDGGLSPHPIRAHFRSPAGADTTRFELGFRWGRRQMQGYCEFFFCDSQTEYFQSEGIRLLLVRGRLFLSVNDGFSKIRRLLARKFDHVRNRIRHHPPFVIGRPLCAVDPGAEYRLVIERNAGVEVFILDREGQAVAHRCIRTCRTGIGHICVSAFHQTLEMSEPNWSLSD